jgi:hypothetical protein
MVINLLVIIKLLVQIYIDDIIDDEQLYFQMPNFNLGGILNMYKYYCKSISNYKFYIN